MLTRTDRAARLAPGRRSTLALLGLLALAAALWLVPGRAAAAPDQATLSATPNPVSFTDTSQVKSTIVKWTWIGAPQSPIYLLITKNGVAQAEAGPFFTNASQHEIVGVKSGDTYTVRLVDVLRADLARPLTITTTLDRRPPETSCRVGCIRIVQVKEGKRDATFAVTTLVPASIKVDVGLQLPVDCVLPAVASSAKSTGDFATQTSVKVAQLQPDTLYYYTVAATDSMGGTDCKPGTFKTLPESPCEQDCIDVKPEIISNYARFTIKNKNGVPLARSIEMQLNGVNVFTAAVQGYQATDWVYDTAPLLPGMPYAWTVTATDQQGHTHKESGTLTTLKRHVTVEFKNIYMDDASETDNVWDVNGDDCECIFYFWVNGKAASYYVDNDFPSMAWRHPNVTFTDANAPATLTLTVGGCDESGNVEFIAFGPLTPPGKFTCGDDSAVTAQSFDLSGFSSGSQNFSFKVWGPKLKFTVSGWYHVKFAP